MLKKVIYILASSLLGFLLIMYSITYNTYSTLQSSVKEGVENKNYLDVERYFSSALDSSSVFVKTPDEADGTHIEVYYALNETQKKLLDSEGKETSTTYSTLESGVQFILFHLPEDFKLADEEGKTGGVNLVFENGEKVLFPYKTEEGNYYNSALNFSFLPLTISYSQFAKVAESNENIDVTSSIASVEFIDGSGTVKYNYAFGDVKPTFNNKFHTDFEPVLNAYNNAQKEAAEGKEISEETRNKIVDDYNAIFENNEAYVLTHDMKEIYKSSKFLFGVISTAVIFLALDILVAWFIFKKKKIKPYIPPYQRTQKPAVKPEPEQFNRAVFDVDADEVVEVISGTNQDTSNE